MKPIELQAALQPLVGKLISVDTVDGHAIKRIGSVMHLAPADRLYYRYDILLEFANERFHGVVIPSARVKAVEIIADLCIVRYGRNQQKHILILGEQLRMMEVENENL